MCGVSSEVGIQVGKSVKKFMQAVKKDLIGRLQIKSQHLLVYSGGHGGAAAPGTNTHERRPESGTLEVTCEGATGHAGKTWTL